VNCNVLDERSDDDYYSIIPQKLYDYDEIETIVMHNLIFRAIKFDEEICEFTFQVFISNTPLTRVYRHKCLNLFWHQIKKR
jgi:hypothetical protein